MAPSAKSDIIRSRSLVLAAWWKTISTLWSAKRSAGFSSVEAAAAGEVMQSTAIAASARKYRFMILLPWGHGMQRGDDITLSGTNHNAALRSSAAAYVSDESKPESCLGRHVSFRQLRTCR